jgi:hypothetical protein
MNETNEPQSFAEIDAARMDMDKQQQAKEDALYKRDKAPTSNNPKQPSSHSPRKAWGFSSRRDLRDAGSVMQTDHAAKKDTE